MEPIIQKVAPIRKALGVRSVFNILGPLTNAAGAQHVVIGVFQVWVAIDDVITNGLEKCKHARASEGVLLFL